MPDRPRDPRPLTLSVAVGLLAVEAFGLAVLTSLWIYDVATKTATQRQWAVTAAIVLVLLTGLFGTLAHLLWRGRAGARNPAVAVHLFALAVGYWMIRGGLIVAGILLLALCVGGVAVLLAPPTTRALHLR